MDDQELGDPRPSNIVSGVINDDNNSASSNSSSYTDYYDDEDGDSPNLGFQSYAARPDWKDVKPVAPDPWEDKVLGIPYTDRFRDVSGYFRSIFRKGELSERSLQLTEDCISLNPADSTVWVFRRKCLLALGKSLINEVNYLDGIIVEQPKNYQVWQHRRWLIEQIGKPESEKEFTEKLFAQDCKNYHAWQHRQWIVSHFNWWDGELEYTEKLINEDTRNNSAWNHRYFVLKRTNQLDNETTIEKEVIFTIENILKEPDNESPWNYLRGILAGVGLCRFPEKTKVFDELISVHSYLFRVDVIDEKLKEQEVPDQQLVKEALDIVDHLSNKVDKIRSEYWSFVGRSIRDKYKL